MRYYEIGSDYLKLLLKHMNDTHLVKLKYILRKKEVMPYAIQKNTVCSLVFVCKTEQNNFLDYI